VNAQRVPAAISLRIISPRKMDNRVGLIAG
jgi:hypothetical protein